MLNRRKFIKSGSMAVGGLLVSFCIPKKCEASNDFKPNAFLHITSDNRISVILSKVEMGQGIWTTLSMLIAEELDVELEKIEARHAPVSKDYYTTIMPQQGTFGSCSTWTEFDRYRMAGATARVMLMMAASKKTGVNIDRCKTSDGFVIVDGKRFSYGELCEDAAAMKPGDVKLKDADSWRLIGRSQKSLDGRSKINGTARYGIDFSAPGLLTALLVRPPVFKGKVKSFDQTETMKVKGVEQVVQTSKGVAVIATNFWSAKKARDLLKIEWDIDEDSRVDSEKQFLSYRELARNPGVVVDKKGEVDNAPDQSDRVIDLEYWVPYLAHFTMEPLNASVRITGDRCEIWAGTQLQTVDQKATAALLNISEENVTIETPLLGGGFGRRGSLESDFVLDAVEIAKVSGKFIKLIWTREDDTTCGYYRPAYLHRVQVGLKNNEVVSWRHRTVGQSVFAAMLPAGKIDDDTTLAIKGSPYLQNFPNYSVEVHQTNINVPVLPWRSVGHSHTCFVMESVIDELAHLKKKDPIDFRKELLKNDARYLGVLNKVEEMSGWRSPSPKGVYRGVAVADRGETYTAYVIEASVDNGRIKVHRVCCAFDCGLIVNPDGVLAQVEGSIVFALSAALYGEITLKNGIVQEDNVNDYRLLRINETPKIEIHLMKSSVTSPKGVGEPGVPAVFPALANALFAATGKRIRQLPLHGRV
ncbi:MAG TPA: molybdopterin cofactor-binding domain-containing protein [Cyclobacteriaceae bacterium]|nr:molybdopterin cofactor-binding domain-containing protein [Cyclobacteriaceae bacterium]